jgi:hypothetical protein
MAKKELNFGKLVLPTKTNVVKQVEATEPLIEKAVEIIHREAAKVNTPAPVSIASQPATRTTAPVSKASMDLEDIAAVKKISMDLPLDLYKALKSAAFNQGTTMKEYVVRLLEADMK